MSQKIRVASLFRSLATGGDENRVLAFTRALDRDRFEHSVITAVPAGAGEGGPMLAEYRAAGVQVIELDDGRLVGKLPGGGAMTAARVTLRLAALLRERRVDVLDARLAAAIPLAVLAGRLAGTPVIVGTQYHFQGWDRPARRALARAAWPRLDALICDSRARLEELLAFVPRPPRGALIPNGIDPPQSAKSRREARRALGLPEQDGVRVIGQVSRLMRFKGHLVLLDAAREVLARAAGDVPDLRVRARARLPGGAPRPRPRPRYRGSGPDHGLSRPDRRRLAGDRRARPRVAVRFVPDRDPGGDVARQARSGDRGGGDPRARGERRDRDRGPARRRGDARGGGAPIARAAR